MKAVTLVRGDKRSKRAEVKGIMRESRTENSVFSKKNKGVEMMDNNAQNSQEVQAVDFEKIIETPEFKALTSRKTKFMTPYIIVFLVAFFMLPILTGYTKVLNSNAIGLINWTWIYAFSMFVLTWVFSTIYTKKASSFDKEAEEIIEKHILK